MWSFNPTVYLNHAWEKTNSVYGKISLVLFYVFVWIVILKCLYGLFDPTFMGRADDCFISGTMTEYDRTFMHTMLRGVCLYALSFFIYVDKGGLHSWNVGFVTVVCLIWIWIAKSSILDKMDDEMYNNCWVGSLGWLLWVWVVWLFATFALCVVDENQAPTGTAEETLPINNDK